MIKNGLYEIYPTHYVGELKRKGRRDMAIAFLDFWDDYKRDEVQNYSYYAKCWSNNYKSRGKNSTSLNWQTAKNWIVEFREMIEKFLTSWELYELEKEAEKNNAKKTIRKQFGNNSEEKNDIETEYMEIEENKIGINSESNRINIKTNKKILSAKLKFSDEDMIIAQKLFDSIRLKDERFKEPNLNKWAEEVRLMVEKDEREHKRISNLIDYIFSNKKPFNAYNGSFWQSNVLSMSKLRKQYETISMQIRNSINQRKKAG